jgi:hypothetical protein
MVQGGHMHGDSGDGTPSETPLVRRDDPMANRDRWACVSPGEERDANESHGSASLTVQGNVAA